jgi:hypothetical protein
LLSLGEEMTTMTLIEGVMFFVVVVAFGIVIVLYTPPWAALLGQLGVVIHAFVHALDDEWTIWRGVRVIVFSVLASTTWWRYLRGTEDMYWRKPPGAKP